MFDPVTRTFSPDDPIPLQLQALVAQKSFAAAYAVLADFLLTKMGDSVQFSKHRACRCRVSGIN